MSVYKSVYNLSGSQSYCAVCKSCIHWESCFSSEKVIICDNFRCEACTFSECPFENTSYCNHFDSDNKKLYIEKELLKMEKFYIIRNEYHTYNFLYGMTSTLADALKAVHDDSERGVELKDVAIEFCQGESLFNYEVTKTMFYHGRTAEPLED